MDGLTIDQQKIQKKLNSVKRGMMKQQLRFDAIYDKIKRHTQLETSRKQLADAREFNDLRGEIARVKGDGLNQIIDKNYARGGSQLNRQENSDSKRSRSGSAVHQINLGACHTRFTTVEDAQNLLTDDKGRFIPTEDICKVCQKPFTME